MKLFVTLGAVAGLFAGLLATGGPALADPPAPPGTPTASSFPGTPTVGPLFRDGITHSHGCTASVLNSPTHDLILTAAHCVTGTAAGYEFAPGYDDGATPYGVWTVVHAYLASQWLATQDPRHDYAILQVARQEVHGHAEAVQGVTGGNVLGLAPRAGTHITDVAYNYGIDDQPIRCAVPVYRTSAYPSFNCHGYVGGSSGSPWLARTGPHRPREVVGVIGGLHQGGCYEYTSYSSPFASDIYRVFLRAVQRRHPDTAPAAGSDGC